MYPVPGIPRRGNKTKNRKESMSSSPSSASAADPNINAASSESSSRSITGKKRRAPRRRGGDEPLAQLVDLTEISKRRKVTTQNRYNKEYAANNLRYAKQVVEWLVLVGKISNLKSGLSIQPHHNGWWFDWQKVNELADDVCDYCSSKTRKLKCGKVVNEAKHNLLRYRNAVSHCFAVYRVKHTDEMFDHAKVETYNMTCKHFFDSIKKQENELKAKGLMKIGTGGDVFSEEFYVECSKRLLKAGDYRAALFNHTGMHTAGRMGMLDSKRLAIFVSIMTASRYNFRPACSAVL